MTDSLITFSPRVRKSPFFDATIRAGCKAYSVYNHMYMPLYYESPVGDFWNLVNGVTLWDVAVERQVQISGPDAASFTQYLTARNLSKCAVGQCKYVLLTDENGGIINDPVLLRLAEDTYWLSLADSDVLLWAKALAHAGQWNVGISEPDVSPLQIQGPLSTGVMRDLFGERIVDLKYFRFRETELSGIPVLVSRTGWSGEPGYEVFLRDGSQGDRLWDLIMECGRPHGIRPGAPNTIRRIEGGMLSYGSDMGLPENPFELGLDRLVDLDMEADFCGKDALKRIRAEGVSRKMVGLEIQGEPVVNANPWPVLSGTETAGKVTSAAYSPRLEKNIALAIVALERSKAGTELTVETDRDERSATVVPLPFHDPRKSLAIA